MRYYIIFGVTIILLLLILFFNPFLGIYNNSVTISYNYNDKDYEWTYKIEGDSLTLKEESDNNWIFIPNKNGVSEITFIYSNNDKIKYKIFYKFRVIGKRIYWIEGSGTGLVDYPNPY